MSLMGSFFCMNQRTEQGWEGEIYVIVELKLKFYHEKLSDGIEYIAFSLF